LYSQLPTYTHKTKKRWFILASLFLCRMHEVQTCVCDDENKCDELQVSMLFMHTNPWLWVRSRMKPSDFSPQHAFLRRVSKIMSHVPALRHVKEPSSFRNCEFASKITHSFFLR
jgi:hypothetical protein